MFGFFIFFQSRLRLSDHPPISITPITPLSDTPRLQGILPAAGLDSKALIYGFEQISHPTN
jgi:hypothetical protein